MGMMKKKREAAVVFAAVALKSITGCNLVPCVIHIIVKLDQGGEVFGGMCHNSCLAMGLIPMGWEKTDVNTVLTRIGLSWRR